MITIPIWLALLALFVAFGLGFFMMACFAAAGRADAAIEQGGKADPLLIVDPDALPAGKRETIGGDKP